MDEWNQYLYDAGNNPVSKDLTISPIKHYQWIGSPYWARHHDATASLSALVSAKGRIFYVIDEGPKESIQLPAETYLYARDAFNGIILWKRPISEWQDHLFPLKSGPAYLPRRLVATGDRVYVTLGIDAPLSEVDAATGEVIRTFEGTDETSEILLADNTLFLIVGRPERTFKKFTSKTTYTFGRGDEGSNMHGVKNHVKSCPWISQAVKSTGQRSTLLVLSHYLPMQNMFIFTMGPTL